MDIIAIITHIRFQQFVLGFLGAITYFVIAWTGFIPALVEDPFLNPKLKNPLVILFFACIAGILCVVSDIRTLVMCFAHGLAIRPVLVGLFKSVNKNEGD